MQSSEVREDFNRGCRYLCKSIRFFHRKNSGTSILHLEDFTSDDETLSKSADRMNMCNCPKSSSNASETPIYSPGPYDVTTREGMLDHLVALAREDLESGYIDIETALRLVGSSCWLEGNVAARK